MTLDPADPDVVVVGAGPAGSVAALVMARAGLKVVMVDRAAFPRDKPCGDLVLPRAAEVLRELGIVEVLHDALTVPRQRSVSAKDLDRCHDGARVRPERGVRMLPRRIFDMRLAEQAQKAGATLLHGRLVGLVQSALEPPSVTVHLHTNGSAPGSGGDLKLRSRFVVGADGATSRVAQLIGARTAVPDAQAFALRRYARATSAPLGEHLDFIVDLEAFGTASEAYGWVFPTSPTAANVGVCLWGPDAGKRAAPALGELFEVLPEIRPDLPLLAPTSRPIGGFIRFDAAEVRRVVGNVVLVGDAAGLSQPASGEGISYALRSGVLAGQAIVAVDGGTGDLEDYDAAVSRELVPGISAGLMELEAGMTVASSNLRTSRPIEVQAGREAKAHDVPNEPDVLRRSTGVLVASLGDRVVAVDTVAAAAHLIEGSAGWLLMYDQPMAVDAIVDELVGYTNAPASQVRSNVVAAIEWLQARCLLGRHGPSADALPWPGSPLAAHGRFAGLAHPILDARIAFRSSDVELVATLDEFFAGGLPDVKPTHWIDVEPDDLGGVTVTATDERRFPSEREWLGRLVDIVNECATQALGLAVLNAGAVRAPSGDVLVLLGHTDTARSMLTAALVHAGCDYLGDEYVGIRAGTLNAVACPTPLHLEAESAPALALPTSHLAHVPVPEVRPDVDILRGDHGPVRGLLFVDHQPDHPATAERLDAEEALEALLVKAPDLGRAGEPGVQALCDLAATIPAVRVSHHDAPALARILAIDGLSALGDDLDHDLRCERRRLNGGTAVALQHAASAAISIRRAPDVDWATIEADGAPAAVLRARSMPTCGLIGPALALWLRLESEATFEGLVRATAEAKGGSDDQAARDVAWLLSQFAVQGFLALGDGASGAAVFTPLAEKLAPDGPTEAASTSILQSSSIPQLRTNAGAGDWVDWASTAVTHDVAATLVVTDHPEANRALRKLLDSSDDRSDPVAPPQGHPVEVRVLPGSDTGVLVRTGAHLDWSPPEAVLSSLALAVGAQLGKTPFRLMRSLPPAPARRLYVDPEGRLLIDDHDRARRWLFSGAEPARSSECRTPLQSVSLLLDERDSELVMWVEAVELSASRSNDGRPALLLLLAENDIGSITSDEREGTVHAQVHVSQPPPSAGSDQVQHSGATSVAERPTVALRLGGNRPRGNQSIDSEIPQWAARLGEVSYGNASAKISRGGVTVGRPLIAVGIGESREDLAPTSDVEVQRISQACIEIGMPPEWAVEAATVTMSAGRLLVGEQHGESGTWRRKLYVNEPGESVWQWLMERWPDHLAKTSRLPTWAAWKWSNDPGTAAERSIELGHLGGAETVGKVVEPTLDSMGSDWAEVVRHLISPLHLTGATEPHRDDSLTIDEGGRRTVDLTARGRNRHVVLGELEPELRWLAAVAGHDRAAADELVAWAWTGRLSVLIFGTDGRGDPFVNFYISRP